MHPQYERLLTGGGTLMAFLLIWQIGADSGAVNPLLVSSPTRIIAAAGMVLVELIRHIERHVEAWRPAVAA